MAALEAEAQAAAEQAEVEGKTHPGEPEDKAQRNFTDAESRIMPGPGGRDFLQAYNCQAVVDSAHQVIVAARATNLPSDKQQAAAMMQETIRNTGVASREVSADAGYDPPKVVDQPHDLSVEPVFGQIKEGRGFRQFLLRGLEKVTVQTCGDLGTIRPLVEGQPSTEFPLQTVSVPSNVNSYWKRSTASGR